MPLRPPSRRRSLPRRRRRLLAEPLEDRRLLAVTFEFNFVNDDNNTLGFNNPVVGDEFKTALETAAARLGDSLLHDATIQMDVFSEDFTGAAVAHAVSDRPASPPGGGFINRVIPGKILGEGDSNGAAADGRIEVFFFDAGDVFTYVTDPATGVGDDEIDFQAVIIHELVHAIGFTSATNEDGSDDDGNGINSPGTWTTYDRFLSDADGNRLIDADPQSATAFKMNTSNTGWPTHSIGGPGPDAGLFFDGPIASGIYGGPVPLFSPTAYSLASTGSHLDSEGFPGPSVFSPTTHLMSHATVDGTVPQELTLLEKGILADIGIMVQEDEPPQITVPTNIVVEGNARGGFLGINQAIDNFLNGATATDRHDPSPQITNNKPNFLPLGQNPITFTAIDASGNTDTAIATISVFDTTPPTISVSPTTAVFEANSPSGVSGVTLPFVTTVSDVVDPNPLVSFNQGTSFPLGTTTGTYTARDFRNNRATFDVEIVVQDTTAPEFTLPSTVTINGNLPTGADLSNAELLQVIQAGSSDLVDLDLTVSASQSIIPFGTTSVTFTVQDDSGNSADATTLLTVNDASFVVTTLDDELDADPASDLADLSLREAISLANAADGVDTIQFHPTLAGSVLLNASLGSLVITDAVNLFGLGPQRTTIDGRDGMRVFDITENAGDVRIEDVTITGGRTILDFEAGAGIRSRTSGVLSVIETVITDNETFGTAGAGAGIEARGGTVVIDQSVLSNNVTHTDFSSGGGFWSADTKVLINNSQISGNRTEASNASGAGLYLLDGSATITGSIISGNVTQSSGSGGAGIALLSSEATIRDSTISGNTTQGFQSPGGGIRSVLTPLKVINSTISGNASATHGGGIFADRSDVQISHSTVVANSAATVGGGIGVPAAGIATSLSVDNSIIAANTDNGTAPDVFHTGALSIDSSIRFTLIGDNTGTTLPESASPNPSSGNIVGSSSGAGIIDPMLSPLGDQGGSTLAHRPLTGSPVINHGDPTFDPTDFAPPLVNDQRGVGFPRVGQNRIDMGSVEFPGEVIVTWSDPADVTYPIRLGPTQLNATANVAGTFTYAPPEGVLLAAGLDQILTVTFDPADPSLDSVVEQVMIDVLKGDPVLTWSTPDPIVVGTALDVTQLNAESDIDGSFVYDPIAGTVLDVGTHVLSVEFTPEDSANYNNATATVMIEVVPTQEFGDAPAAYPVLLIDDGARHLPSNLTLGPDSDLDTDGQPSPAADGDGADDDGVFAISDIVAAATETIASVTVEASADAKLDAWIDWNQDGDWQDAGEQVLTSVDVVAGENHLSITVPAGANPGSTAARYRISSLGNLAPTGQAADGEVEDYLVSILDGAAAPSASMRLVGIDATLANSSGSLNVSGGGITFFAAPIGNLGEFTITGSNVDESLTIDLSSPGPLPSGGLNLDGGAGGNTLVIVGDGQSLDFTDPLYEVNRFRRLDLSSADVTSVSLNASTVDALSPVVHLLSAKIGDDDQFNVLDAPDWRMTDPIVSGNTFQLTATNLIGNQMIEAEVAHPWQNFLRASDINNDGMVSASDALRIINELARRAFSSAAEEGLLDDPLTVQSWPDAYFDHNGDDRVTALDALRVINDLARLFGSGEGESIATSVLTDAVTEEESLEQTVNTIAPATAKIRSMNVDQPWCAPSDASSDDAESDSDDSIAAIDEVLTNLT